MWRGFSRLIRNYSSLGVPVITYIELCGMTVANELSKWLYKKKGSVTIVRSSGWAGCVATSAARHLSTHYLIHLVEVPGKTDDKMADKFLSEISNISQYSKFSWSRKFRDNNDLLIVGGHFHCDSRVNCKQIFTIGPEEASSVKIESHSQICARLLHCNTELGQAFGLSVDEINSLGLGDVYTSLIKTSKIKHWKGSSGHVVIVGGSPVYQYPPFIAAETALVCGCDSVRAIVPKYLWRRGAGNQSLLHTVPMKGNYFQTVDIDLILDLVLELLGSGLGRTTVTLLIGPGLGGINGPKEALFGLLAKLVDIPIPIVLDGSLGGRVDPYLIQRRYPVVLTPNRIEFKLQRGEKLSTFDIDDQDLLSWAKITNATVVITGPTDLICDGYILRRCKLGHSILAKNGTGDILAGMIAGLLAKGLLPTPAAEVGCVLMGIAGERGYRSYGEACIVSQIIPILGEAIDDIMQGRNPMVFS